jgi:selenocysteine lyase/cysteine desulfurase
MIGPGPGKNWSHAVISFTFDHRLASNGARIKDSDLARKLGEKGICVRSGLFCAQPLVEERLGLTGAVRVSIHVYNNLEDIDKLVNEIKNIQKK